MAMTTKARTRGLKKTQQLLGAGADVRSYGIGVIGPDPRRTIALIVIVFAAAIALSFIFLNVIIIPSVLLVLVIFGAIDRPASLAMTDRGVAVFGRSEITGRPRKFLTVLPPSVLGDRGVVQSNSRVHLPGVSPLAAQKGVRPDSLGGRPRGERQPMGAAIGRWGDGAIRWCSECTDSLSRSGFSRSGFSKGRAQRRE